MTPLAAWLEEVEARAASNHPSRWHVLAVEDVPALVALLRLAVSVVDEARDVSNVIHDSGEVWGCNALDRALDVFDAAVAERSQAAAESKGVEPEPAAEEGDRGTT